MSMYNILKIITAIGEKKSICIEIERNARRNNICKETLQRKKKGTSIVDYAKEYPSCNDFVLPIHEK